MARSHPCETERWFANTRGMPLMNNNTTRLKFSVPLLAACVLTLAVGSASAQRGGAPDQAGAGPAGAGVPGAAGPGGVAGPGRPGGPGAGGPGGGFGRVGGPRQAADPEQRGLLVNEAGAQPGYTLFAPLNATTTYLIDLEGNVVRTWESGFVPGAWVYFTEDGHLLRGGREPEPLGFSGGIGGQGGRFQKFTFDGELVWDYALNTEQRLSHHDVEVL